MTGGFGHVYIETHDWDGAAAFWRALCFDLEFATDHGSGMLRSPKGGPGVFLAEQSIEDPLAIELYLDAPADYEPPDGVQVVSPFRPTHWGSKVMVVQDPDGHRFRIEAPVDETSGHDMGDAHVGTSS
jgi:catechol 2,3-dioxygenase-like lactoylglutathione lyase family enzyme